MSKEESEWDHEKERIKKIVDDCVAKIGEHVDAVQVMLFRLLSATTTRMPTTP